MSLDGPLDSMNTNVHGQLVSSQTGLPPLNPNNPPPPPPNGSSGPPPGQGKYIYIIFEFIYNLI
jgi:hypothetical protein